MKSFDFQRDFVTKMLQLSTKYSKEKLIESILINCFLLQFLVELSPALFQVHNMRRAACRFDLLRVRQQSLL